MGRWCGRTLEEVAGAEAEAVSLWLSDPAAAPHGGESLREFRTLIGAGSTPSPPSRPGD
ncbi:hypothetical protein SNE510_27460 [Streptomyces sp. NE5-10]|uniref:hypothetical protein n=1 Tax=Streptomyces sp. NE5-10 TaxID=2759674 RepID=UPI001A58E989|nr:hypothetical protein SNE510_27460 [Streptomyces sp. NE5-10]